MRCPYKNKAHRSAWKRGRAAALRGASQSLNPYRRTEKTTLYFYKAWAAGFESATAASVA